jgi:DNA-binding response OmpR family regulator
MPNSSAVSDAPRVLIIEDARDIAHLVQLHLRDANFQVELAHDGASGLEKALKSHYDLIVLDLMLPRVDGLEICRQVRAAQAASREYSLILMLTSKGTELDRVLGLEIGADDYLTKPFSIRELIARVKALFRREDGMRAAHQSEDGDLEITSKVIRIGVMTIETTKRKVTLGEDEVSLTSKEFDLLHLFARHPGQVYSRTQLLDSVWGLGYEGYEHTVNSHINRLRAKIETNPAQPRYLLTVWGVGYKFTDKPKAEG